MAVKEVYEPIRVLKVVYVHGETEEVIRRDFPNVSKIEVASYMPKAYLGSYIPNQIIDVPTTYEREFLLTDRIHRAKVAALIPQHKDEYDYPTSNLARSRKGSHIGREKWKVEMAKLRMKNEQARIANEKEKEKEKRRKEKDEKKTKKAEEKKTVKSIDEQEDAATKIKSTSKDKGGDNK